MSGPGPAGRTDSGLAAGGPCGRAEGTSPLIVVLAAGQFGTGLVIENHVLLGGLIDSYADHGQALSILFLALTCHAVTVLLCSLGMQFCPARHALRHCLAFVWLQERAGGAGRQ